MMKMVNISPLNNWWEVVILLKSSSLFDRKTISNVGYNPFKSLNLTIHLISGMSIALDLIISIIICIKINLML